MSEECAAFLQNSHVLQNCGMAFYELHMSFENLPELDVEFFRLSGPSGQTKRGVARADRGLCPRR